MFLTGLLVSCSPTNENPTTENVAEEQKNVVTEPTEQENTNYVAIDSDEALVATALMAAPKESREGCKVIGFNTKGEFVTFQEGTNEFICLVDDLNNERFSAACYHKSLDPFMARGRELKKEGKTHSEIFDIREAEVKDGKLKMGEPGSALHLYFGNVKKYDPATSEVEDAIYRYVVYLPWATAESTGLPETPRGANHPWIMNPGSHKAHIMISPVPDNEMQ